MSDITLTFVGDLLCYKEQIDCAYDPLSKQHDFAPCFLDVKKYFTDSDYVVGNLETPLAGNKVKLSQRKVSAGFNAPDEFLVALKNMGIDCFTTANNHCYDRDEEGLLQTIRTLDKYHVDHVGTYASSNEQSGVFIKEINGVRIAFIAYTFGINHCVHGNVIPKNKSYLVNFIAPYELQQFECLWNIFPNLLKRPAYRKVRALLTGINESYTYNDLCEKIEFDIKKAKASDVDLVILLPHVGIEFIPSPLPFSKEWVKRFARAGADVIIGGHPHVVQPLDFCKIVDGQSERTCFVIFSLGNFIAVDRPYWPTDLCIGSLILNLHISYDSNKNRYFVSNVSYTPTHIHKKTHAGKEIIAVSSILDSLRDLKKRGMGDSNEYRELFSLNANIYKILTGIKSPCYLPDSQYILKLGDVHHECVLPANKEVIRYFFKKGIPGIGYGFYLRFIRALNFLVGCGDAK